MLVSIYHAHRNPSFWPDPEHFDPTRFAPEREKPQRGAYMPFAIGQRKCIGDHFAMMEAKLILIMILQKFHVRLAPGDDLRMQASVTFRPENGLRAWLKPRRPEGSHT